MGRGRGEDEKGGKKRIEWILTSTDLTICHKLFSSNGEPDEGNAFDGFASKETEIGRVGVLHDVFKTRHEPVVVSQELILGRVSHRGDRRYDLLQHQFAAFFDKFLEFSRQHLMRKDV